MESCFVDETARRLATAHVGKEWQAMLMVEAIRKVSHSLTVLERAALCKAHLVFAAAEAEALMALQNQWYRRRFGSSPDGKGTFGRWQNGASKALGERWAELNRIPWSNAEHGDPPTVVDWYAGLFGLRNHLLHPTPANDAEQGVIERAGLPIDADRLDEEYLERFGAVSTRTNAVLYWISEALQN